MKRNILFAFVVAVTSICSGQWLERRVVIGDTFGGIGSPDGVVVNPISGNVYIESSPIQIFNPSTLEKLRGPGTSGTIVFCPPSGKGYVLRQSLVIIDAIADTVMGSAVLPFGPDQFAYSRTSNRLYLAHTNDTILCVFDPEGDSVLRNIDVGFNIRALQWDTVWDRVYIGGNSDSADLRALYCAGDTLSPGIRTDLYDLHSLVLSTTSHKLYCLGDDTSDYGAVAAVSTDSLKSLGTVPGLRRPDIAAYSPVTDRLYGADGDYVYIVDCRGDTIQGTRVLDDVDISTLAVNSLSGNVYLGSFDSALVVVMDTTDSVIGSVSLPASGGTEIDALSFSPGRNELYGATDGDKVLVVDASADTLADTVSYVATIATRMIHNPAGNKLYVLCPDQDEVLVFDSTLGTPKHIPGGVYNASGVPILNPALNRIYVADGSRLRVVDSNSDSLLGSRIMYGVSSAIPVMVPYLNKLYVFSGSGRGGDSAYVYDCLRDTVASVFYLTDYVPCAVYDPRSNRVFFACHVAPTIRVLDPTTNSVVKTFDLVGGSYRGRMALNPDLGRLYYTDQTADRMFTIDLLADSVIASESLPWNIEAMFLNRRLGKLYLCSQDTARVLVFDCGQGTVVDTIHAGYLYAGLMDERNDKLYLRYGAVVDCRYDSVVTRLDSLSPRSMAWDAIGNRVFMAPTSWVYDYRDDPYGIAAEPVAPREKLHATIIRGLLFLPQASGAKRGASSVLLDITGRKILDLQPGANNVRALAPGVYFVRSGTSAVGRQQSAVTKVAIMR